MPSYEEFRNLKTMAGKIIDVQNFPEARKPAYKLRIDFGKEGIKQSSAQITALYSKEQLMGRTIIAVTGFPPKKIANFISEVLVLGAIDKDGNVVLLGLDKEGVEPGSNIC